MRMYQDTRRLDFHALGREIKRKREAKGWTQEYLAQLVDRTPRSIMYFENRGQQLSPSPHGAALHHAPLVKVDDLHGRISGRLREGAEVNGPLGGIVAVILRRLPAPGALLHLKQLLVIVNALGEILFRCLAVAVVVAPIVVPLAVLRFGKLPCDKGAGGRLVIAQGKTPAIVEGNGFQNLITLVAFYVISSFPASGQVGPKCMNVTKYPVEPGRKVLGYSGPENRREKA